MNVAIFTLGCKVNQYETAAMEQELSRRGHHLVPFDGPADAYIINTCTVTAVSDKKSRNMVRRAKRAAPDAVVAVCGCYSQTAPEEVAALGADLVSGSAGRIAFLDRLEEKYLEKQRGNGVPCIDVDAALSRRTFEVLAGGGMEGRTRAFLKVEDGCANFCSYCIIPYARGPVRSLSPAQAVEQACALARSGYREIVLTGIELSSWGRDLPGRPALIDLIEAVCAAVPSLRIRLGSLEPRTITEDFCRKACALPNLCPHFHLSLQSGCDDTLRRMNRRYNTARYAQSIDLLRHFFPNPAITTDLIAGFPGETQEEFTQTLSFLRRCAFSSMHVFPYSRRSGTPAANMPGQVPHEVKEQRVCQAMETAEKMQERYLAGLVGTTQAVLFEEVKDGLWQGHAPNYIPVRAAGERLHNVLRSVRIERAEKGILYGTVLPEGELHTPDTAEDVSAQA